MKRNRKLAILVILLVCISLAAFGVDKYEEQKEIIKNSDEIILEVAGDKINTLSWECDTGSFGFHRNDEGKWLYDEDEAFPVDEEKIGALLGLFEEFGVSFIYRRSGRFRAVWPGHPGMYHPYGNGREKL